MLACDHAARSGLCWKEFGSTSSPRKSNTTLEDSNGKRDPYVWDLVFLLKRGWRLSNLQSCKFFKSFPSGRHVALPEFAHRPFVGSEYEDAKVGSDPGKKVLHVLEIREFVWGQGSSFMDDHFRSVLCSRNLCMDGQYVNLPVPKQLDSLRRCLETTRYWGREPRIYGMITLFSRKSV